MRDQEHSAEPRQPRDLTVLVDTYPHTSSLLSGAMQNAEVTLHFRRFSPIYSAFAAMVERREFDVSEMALATYVQARGAGRPITLLPVTMLARFQHPYLMKRADGPITNPRDLEGQRIGLQSYAQTTGVWVRGILSRQFGVDLSTIEWVVQENPHVAGVTGPDNVVPAPAGQGMGELLNSGDIAAAIVSYKLDGATDAVPVFGDLAAVTRDWYQQTGVLQINHMVCVGTDLVEQSPEVVATVLGLFRAALVAAEPQPAPDGALAWTRELDMVPFGSPAIRPSVQMMLDLCIDQQVVQPGLTIDDLLHRRLGEIEAALDGHGSHQGVCDPS